MDEPELPRPGPQPSADPDPEWTQYVAWLDREVAAGRDPDEWANADVDPALLSVLCGPDGLGGEGPGLLFDQFGAADVLRPGPVLSALTDQAVCGIGQLTDAELIGVLQASRRMEIRESYKQAVLTAEFARRREAAWEDAKNRNVPVHCRAGGFPGEELAMELVVARGDAARLIETATDVMTRLPATRAGMAAGLIDNVRAGLIAFYTRSLADADLAHADAVLAADAPDLRVEQLARKAAALEMKLAPDAVKARKEHEKNTAQRVEVRREMSGNASLAGREMGTADVMASKAYLDAIAVKLRNAGLNAPIGRLRALALADLTQGRNPLDRLKPAPAASAQPAGTQPAGTRPADAQPAGTRPTDAQPTDAQPTPGYSGPDGWPGWDPGEADTARYEDPVADELDETTRRGPVRTGDPVPLPAAINLIIPAGTVLGWSAAPGQAGSWGLLDRDETQAIVKAASRHPRTRWCVTLTAPDGTAIAHACARGQHPGLLDDLGPQPPPRTSGSLATSTPTAAQAAQLAELLRRLNVTLEPIARGRCDHTHAEDRYTPSRKLRHLIRARSATCDAPGCNVQATYADLDHTAPYPGGLTDQCNLAPRCRTHHRAKQAPDWHVDQPEPDVTRWTLPSGRVHTAKPTTYET